MLVMMFYMMTARPIVYGDGDGDDDDNDVLYND